jgi:hypothetical protein
MEPRLRIVSLMISVCLLLFILELVRRKKLMERYSLLWLVMGATLSTIAAWPRAAQFLSRLFGVLAVSNMVFLAAMLFIVVLCIHFSVRISSLSEEMRKVAQELALLKTDAARRKREKS